MRFKSIFILAGWLGMFTMTALAKDTDADVKITRFEVGFGSAYRVGNWAPVKVTLESKKSFRGTLAVVVPDGDGVPSRVTQEIALADHETKTYPLYVRFGRVYSDVTVTVERSESNGSGSEVHVEKLYRPEAGGIYRPAVSAENSLMVLVGQKSGLLDATIRTTDQATADRTTAASVLDPNDLPDAWIGYDGVHTVLLTLSNPAVAEMVFSPKNPRRHAIDQWVRRGGRLVLLGGQMDPQVIEDRAKKSYDPATSLLPGRPVGTTVHRRVTPIESYIDSSVAIPLPAGAHRHQLPAFELADLQGTVMLQGETPLVVQKNHGFGSITFLAIDPSATPLDEWRDRGRVMAKLLDLSTKADDVATLSSGAIRHFGFNDLSGQMRSALDRFDGVTAVSFGLILVIVLFYTALIGPADYFLLKKIGRMSWTWVTFTLVVVLFGVGMIWFAHRMKGDQIRLHRIDLVDVDTTSRMVRGTSWANLFSPQGKRYDLAFSGNLPDSLRQDPKTSSVAFSWLGLPGQGLGGMNPREPESSVWRKPYDFAPDRASLDGVPLLNWSTKSFTARWSAEWNDDFAFNLREENELPTGSVTNPLENQPLEHCLLIYDRWVYPLGTLTPGESVSIDDSQNPTKLNSLLTGRTMVAEDDDNKVSERVTPYQVENVDPTYVLQIMMFYEAAGGERYARLSNRYQPFVDLSHLLAPGQAMLVGQLSANAPAATRFTVDGKPLDSDQHATVFRFILPVKVK